MQHNQGRCSGKSEYLYRVIMDVLSIKLLRLVLVVSDFLIPLGQKVTSWDC